MQSLRADGRAFAAALHDGIAVALAGLLAAILVANQPLSSEALDRLATALAVALPLQIGVNLLFGVYQGIWRYTSLPDIQRVIFAVVSGTVVVSGALSIVGLDPNLGHREYVLYPVFLAMLMAGSRMAYRSFMEWSLYGRGGEVGLPVVVLGAGDAAVGLVKELGRSQEWRVVGLLDDDTSKRGRLLQGVRVLGPVEDLPRFAQRLKVRHAIIAMPSVAYQVRRRVVEICKQARVSVMTVPTLNTVVGGKVTAARVRKVAVEDLMKRDPVTLDDAGLHDLLSGQVVMVTGAGGSIGAELCRQIAAFQPAMLVLFDQSEYAMYRIDEALRESFPEIPVVSAIGDVKNAKRVAQVMHQYSPAHVFHAAAYKHVPLMEEANAWEAVQNNVLGTYVVARAAIDFKVKKFVFVSTDKAVNPTNVMGATKRLAEMVCQALQTTSTTRFEMVRFGNVLGSAGSVIPKFQEQIDRGGPVTVTHPEMVRYFMSIPEAAQLVLQAGCMGLGGEIFVMDMGEPVKIVDLARDMIRLSELSESEIRIVYTGLRPGEKLFEELLADDEHTRPTPHPKLRIAKAREVAEGWLDGLLAWLNTDRVPTDSEVRRDLKRWVPEFQTGQRPRLKSVPAKSSG
ncbi:polysaccharide biosynthesis protein [Usitatibacter palustris]|uniref:UDP-N-acetyl-alpha-D-glucosamine C6 dehydratase n=1 Tax=Usitatibacter palustris TaxID=2732487 RepID=A0A6M4HFU7_9PROT|nr:nucleoside-diphosphate sugar epimerase/dehydratase [Usitatibacter palustris]QJR16917.1 UDP-N-acetyl-alpha-D-glucosamine C6 dehydratase [Usitatibacter palustris]